MAIRVQHSYGGALAMGAYTAGRANARERREKYAMSLMLDQQRLGMQGATRRSKYGSGADEPVAGTVKDPFAEAVEMGDTWKAKTIRAQRKANLRGMRRGEETVRFPGAETKFIPAPTEEEVKRGEELADMERRETRDERRARATLLPAVPEDIDPAMHKNLSRRLNDLREGLTGGKVDFDDPAARDKLEGEIESYKKDIASLPIPTPAEKARRNRAWMGDDGIPYDAPGPGRRPGTVADGEFVPDAPNPADVAAEKAKEKTEADRLKAEEKTEKEATAKRDRLTARATKLLAELDPVSDKPKYANFAEALDAAIIAQEEEDKAFEELDRRRAAAAAPPAASPEAAPTAPPAAPPAAGAPVVPTAAAGIQPESEWRTLKPPDTPAVTQAVALPPTVTPQQVNGELESLVQQMEKSGVGYGQLSDIEKAYIEDLVKRLGGS